MKKRFAAGMLSFLLAACLLCPFAALADETQETLTEQKKQAQQEYEDAKKQLAALQSQTSATKGQIGQLEGQIAEITAQIEAVTAAKQEAQQLVAERRNIEAAAAEALNQKQAEYDANLAQCKTQMGAMQMLDNGGALAYIAQAKSLYEVLTFSETLRQMRAQNSATLTRLNDEADALELARQAAEAATAEAEAAEAALAEQEAQLNDSESQLESALQQANSALSAQQAAQEAQNLVTKAAQAAYYKAIAELDAYNRAQGDKYGANLHFTSLDFGNPLPGHYTITNTFSSPDPWGKPHNGTDFAAGNGTPIYAAADGIVSVARSHSSYGNYVMVTHGRADDGNLYETLYAHMSSYVVSAGTPVAKGDLLGYVGNTGSVWGAYGGYHLHLEIRINNVRANSLNYIPH